MDKVPIIAWILGYGYCRGSKKFVKLHGVCERHCCNESA